MVKKKKARDKTRALKTRKKKTNSSWGRNVPPLPRGLQYTGYLHVPPQGPVIRLGTNGYKNVLLHVHVKKCTTVLYIMSSIHVCICIHMTFIGYWDQQQLLLLLLLLVLLLYKLIDITSTVIAIMYH